MIIKKIETDNKVEYALQVEISLSKKIDTKGKERKLYEIKKGIIVFDKTTENFYFDEKKTDPAILNKKRLKLKVGTKLIKIARNSGIFPETIDILYC